MTVVFNLEYFPFSNYAMYSRPLLPGPTYTYWKLRTVDQNGIEQDFKNKNYYLFHAEQPLIESLHRNQFAQKDLQVVLMSLLKRTRYMNANFVEIRLYKAIYLWPEYKAAMLLDLPIEVKDYVRLELLTTSGTIK